jgi:hypothetical protein
MSGDKERVSAALSWSGDDDRPSSVVVNWFSNPLGGARGSEGLRSTMTSWMTNPLSGRRSSGDGGTNATGAGKTEVEMSDIGKTALEGDDEEERGGVQPAAMRNQAAAVTNPLGHNKRQARLGTLSPAYPDASQGAPGASMA